MQLNSSKESCSVPLLTSVWCMHDIKKLEKCMRLLKSWRANVLIFFSLTWSLKRFSSFFLFGELMRCHWYQKVWAGRRCASDSGRAHLCEMSLKHCAGDGWRHLEAPATSASVQMRFLPKRSHLSTKRPCSSLINRVPPSLRQRLVISGLIISSHRLFIHGWRVRRVWSACSVIPASFISERHDLNTTHTSFIWEKILIAAVPSFTTDVQSLCMSTATFFLTIIMHQDSHCVPLSECWHENVEAGTKDCANDAVTLTSQPSLFPQLFYSFIIPPKSLTVIYM